jgi:hypothetical protein
MISISAQNIITFAILKKIPNLRIHSQIQSTHLSQPSSCKNYLFTHRMPPPHFPFHASPTLTTSPACTPLPNRHSLLHPMTPLMVRIVNHAATFVTFAVNSSWRTTTPVKEDVARRCGIWKTGERWSAKLGEFEGGGARRVRCAVCEA